MHLMQPGFMYSACGPFTKVKERIQKETGDKVKIYLSKRTRQSLLSTCHGLWRF